MGDWSVADHFIFGDEPVPKPTWSDPERWAMRVRVIGPGIQLMQTVQKWSCQRFASSRIIGICAEQNYLEGESSDSFVPGWNYLVSSEDRIFEGIARALGANARLEVHGRQRVLCMREPRLFGSAHRIIKASAAPYLEDPLAKFVSGVLREERLLHGTDTELVAGLWTREHGFVHTGLVRVALSRPGIGEVEWTATAAHNLIEARWNGPVAGFPWLQTYQRPLRLALDRWPFAIV